ncbi:MAG: hypothetical protein ACFFDS_02220 [Candidatus Thorarchaeota archaeon]
MVDYRELEGTIDKISSKEDLRKYIDKLQILVYNERSNERVLLMVEKTIELSKEIRDDLSLIRLYSLKISHLHYSKKNLQTVKDLAEEIRTLSERLNYYDGMTLYHLHKWYIHKFEGNELLSKDSMKNATKYITRSVTNDEFIKFIYKYTFAFDNWVSSHDINCAKLFEECIDYAYNNNLFRNLAQTLGILSIIYIRTQNSKKILEISKKIIGDLLIVERMPVEVKALLYYFTGLGYMLELNLNFSEKFFEKAYNILKLIYKKSSYFSNYVVIHSHMITVKALQGKLEETGLIIKKVEDLLKEEISEERLDLGTRKQIYHTLNLNKFYVYSRLKDYESEKMKELIEEILVGSRTLYSNFMLLSEFILNSNLPSARLEELLTIDNFSINRVKHIISFMLLKTKEEDSKEQKFLRRIEMLTNREKASKTTFIENAFIDLIIAQQLFSLKKYGEIYFLLNKYKNQLHRIEVLELRIFMEAFIQVGEYKSGNPLGPALQYMAIKKCRMYGFSRLENILIDYLEIQKQEVLGSVIK